VGDGEENKQILFVASHFSFPSLEHVPFTRLAWVTVQRKNTSAMNAYGVYKNKNTGKLFKKKILRKSLVRHQSRQITLSTSCFEDGDEHNKDTLKTNTGKTWSILY